MLYYLHITQDSNVFYLFLALISFVEGDIIKLNLKGDVVMSILFGKRVRGIREEKGMTQEEVGDRMGVTRAVISQIETGRSKPTMKTKYRLAKALDVTIDTLEGKAVSSNELKDLKLREPMDVVLIPIVGEVRAGVAMYAQNNIIGYQKVDSDQVNQSKTYFYLRVVGDSMNKYIREGDMVLVEHTTAAETGDIVIALIEEENAVIKRLKLLKDSLALIPESTNSEHKTQIYDPEKVSIVGKVVKAERFF